MSMEIINSHETLWIQEQESLKRQLITEDNFRWKVPTEVEEKETLRYIGGVDISFSKHDSDIACGALVVLDVFDKCFDVVYEDYCLVRLTVPYIPGFLAFRELEEKEALRYIGGVDISFSKYDSSDACGALVVLDVFDKCFDVVYEDYCLLRLTVPYVPGFLAFREAPILLQLLDKMKNCAHSLYPQLLMVDGNGLLHPRGFGLACHLGVLANLPTIGVGKNLHHVDGLTQSRVRQLLQADGSLDEEIVTLIGDSGRTWGAAMRSTQGSLKPIFISTGHRVSLDTAVKIAKITCKYRVPEPIRQADIRSRDYLRKHQ